MNYLLEYISRFLCWSNFGSNRWKLILDVISQFLRKGKFKYCDVLMPCLVVHEASVLLCKSHDEILNHYLPKFLQLAHEKCDSITNWWKPIQNVIAQLSCKGKFKHKDPLDAIACGSSTSVYHADLVIKLLIIFVTIYPFKHHLEIRSLSWILMMKKLSIFALITVGNPSRPLLNSEFQFGSALCDYMER